LPVPKLLEVAQLLDKPQLVDKLNATNGTTSIGQVQPRSPHKTPNVVEQYAQSVPTLQLFLTNQPSQFGREQATSGRELPLMVTPMHMESQLVSTKMTIPKPVKWTEQLIESSGVNPLHMVS